MALPIIKDRRAKPETGRSQSLRSLSCAEWPRELTPEEDSTIRLIAENLHRLNKSIVKAVSAGLTVEILRRSRHHDGTGNWGDQIFPNVTKKG